MYQIYKATARERNNHIVLFVRDSYSGGCYNLSRHVSLHKNENTLVASRLTLSDIKRSYDIEYIAEEPELEECMEQIQAYRLLHNAEDS